MKPLQAEGIVVNRVGMYKENTNYKYVSTYAYSVQPELWKLTNLLCVYLRMCVLTYVRKCK